MAQTGYTPILIYSSSTASQAPTAGNLTNSTLGSELAINITDGKLFYKDNGGSVQVIAWKTTPTTAGGTGLTSYTAGDLLYYATGTTLSKLGIGASKSILTSSGTAPQWSASLDTSQGGTGVTSYTAGDLPYYATGTSFSKLGIGAANTVLTSSGSAPQWTAQSSLAVGTASNLLSNATTGVMQITGPGAGTTRVMTIPNANFTAARTDAGQTFTGAQIINGAYDANNPSTSSTPILKVNEGGALSIWFSAKAYNYTWMQAIQDDGSNNLKPLYLQPLGSDIYTGGNIVPQVAAQGVNFTANTPAAGMTSQLLNWYEEGTWTPTVTSSSGTITSVTGNVGRYTRVGRSITCVFNFTISNNGTGAGALFITGLPFVGSQTVLTYYAASGWNRSTGMSLAGEYNPGTGGTGRIALYKYDATYPVATGDTCECIVTYEV